MVENIFMKEVDKFLRTQSVNTRRSYRWFLDRLIEWMEQNQVNPVELDPVLLELFLDEQVGWGENTRRQATCAARSFFRYWQGNKHPVLETKLHRVKGEPQRVLSPKRVIQVLSAFDPATPTGARGLAIVSLMIDTGLRESEVCRLEEKRLNVDDRKLSVIVKGGVWGRAVFSEVTQEHLRGWLRVKHELRGKFGKDYSPPPTVFITLTGAEMEPKTIRELFRRLSRRVGYAISAHDLRRTFATLATKAGAPTRVAMAAGRWNNLGVFEQYTRGIEPEDMEPWYPMQRLADGTL
jgi:site-specific recombinase XerD